MTLSCNYFNDSKISKGIIQYHNSDCISVSECSLKISELTDFDWDTMYVFNGYSTSYDINSSVGFLATGRDLPDDYIQLMFVKNKEVVYQECHPYKSFNIQFRSIDPEQWNKDRYNYYSKEKAEFVIDKKESRYGDFFLNLSPKSPKYL